jgi:hypothetical protein
MRHLLRAIMVERYVKQEYIPPNGVTGSSVLATKNNGCDV